ncbi:glycoside hydrolase family 31 protein [Thermoanaerobacterium sp. RBIITD]|uniref:glycoside hydrolase family 31 protein n=1 Tax=Thermoanaerobacterium sp. RBIITD TaxID=1550240 RepID=UPI000BB99DF8|nr:glycoside hydrolase family 31 protein [Thermoanaerobacterium sp. RBIITD]SNX54842.1 alpha-glucosidase [Thermoanaerobacterium sp. RBIITD]
MSFWETKDTKRIWYIGEVYDFKRDGNSLLFSTYKGIMRIKILSSNCIRITFNMESKFLDIPSFAVVNEMSTEDFSVEVNSEYFTVSTSEIRVNIYKNDGRIVIHDFDENILSEDMEYGFSWTKDSLKCKKRIAPNSHFYGLGEKTGFLDKKGYKYVMWNTDDPLHTPTKDPLYKSIPFLINFNGQYASGIFVDNTCKIVFNLGEESSEYYTFEVNDCEMDYYFIYGPDIKRVISTYTDLTGKMYLPPKWALGYQQCRWSYYPEEVVRELADTFREKEIPCDVIYLDIDYMDGFRVFTWDPNRFPDPERMLKDLKDKGFKVVTIVDPGVKKDAEYVVYRDGIEKGVFCKKLTGEVYIGKVWPGEAAFPDFSREMTRKWWAEKHTELLGKGVSGIWNDMNEPSDFSINSNKRTECTVPNDVIMENDGHPATFRKYHNCYGLNMCRATFEGFKMIKPDERPFILTRSAYAGIQRYSAVWTGDNHSWWEQLDSSMPMLMNIGMSGVPFVGGDVGGFQGNASPELFARWMQLGTFTPFFRAHTEIDTKPHEPWAFGKEVEDICRKYISLRYKLLPYIYNEFYKASKTGLPIMKPLVMKYPEDENVHNLCNQFLFGDCIMVAPIYRPSTYKRSVYIPAGTWFNYWTDEKYKGNSYIIADAPLDTLPIYVKSGAIIPSIPAMNYVGEKIVDTLTLDIYLGEDSEYCLYEDDGISKKYLEGEYRITCFEQKRTDNGINFTIRPLAKRYTTGRTSYLLRFHGFEEKPMKVEHNDKCETNFDNGVFCIKINDTNEEQILTIK